jgi:hypothetical protein
LHGNVMNGEIAYKMPGVEFLYKVLPHNN